MDVYDDVCIKNKIKTYDDKVCTKCRRLNVEEDGVECESFTITSDDSWRVYENKYYLQVYLDNCAHKIMDKQITYYFGDNIFEPDED